MFEFQWVWVLALLPLPWILRLILPMAKRTQEAALHVPLANDFNFAASYSANIKSKKILFWLAAIAWILLVAAAARPQWIGKSIELPVSGRDLMLAVDLSGSMEIEDFYLVGQRVDRLTAIKAVAGEFIERRVGDRLGLILFGRQAYLQTPLTFDRETVKTLLYESVIGLAGKETAIGDAIGLAVKRFHETDLARQQLQAKPTGDKKATDRHNTEQNNPKLRTNKPSDQILILLTDGANTAGEVEPIKAAEFAAEQGLKIYTIGVGADEMLVRSLFGSRRVNPSVDLDEQTLTAIADQTGGRYFRARDTEELNKIYQILDELEPIVQEKQFFRPTRALYPWPLSLAVVIAAYILYRRSVTG